MNKVLFVVLSVFFASFLFYEVRDPDLWWHITIGNWIAVNKSIPITDIWNMNSEGVFRAYSWLFEVIVYYFDLFFSNQGLFVLHCSLAIVLSISYAYILSKLSLNYTLGLILSFCLLIGCASHFALRPQSISWLCFIWIIYGSIFYKKTKNNKYLYLIFLFSVLWVNTNLTLIFIFPVIACLLFFNKKDLLKIFSVILIASFCTPYFGGEWITVFNKYTHPFGYELISEFKAANILATPVQIMIVLLVFSIMLFYKKFTTKRLPLICLTGCYLILGLIKIKFLPFGIILLGVLIALVWNDYENVDDEIKQAVLKLEKLVLKIPIQGASFILIVIVVLRFYSNFLNPIVEEYYPYKAVEYFKKNSLKFPIGHSFGMGGFIMKEFKNKDGSINNKVIIDGRTNVNSKKTWKEFRNTKYFNKEWEDFFIENKVQTIIWNRNEPLYVITKLSKNWCHIYEDQYKENKGFFIAIKGECN